jgi:cellobiose phosphorylase
MNRHGFALPVLKHKPGHHPMNTQNPSSASFPFRIESPSGLSVQINANGSIRRMDHRDIMLNLFLGTETEGGPANVYLRCQGKETSAIPLLGPKSPAAVHVDGQGLVAHGIWQDIRFRVSLQLAHSLPAWFWHVGLENIGADVKNIELIYTQDLALAHYGAVRLNEYYVSHYVDHTPLTHPDRGVVLASRQNLSMGGRYPWTLICALGRGIRFATDALQFYGRAARAGRQPAGLTQGLPGARLQHEHSMAAIQDAPLQLKPGATAQSGFFGLFVEDHPQATSEADLAYVKTALALPEAQSPAAREVSAAAASSANLFSTAPLLHSLELTGDEITALFGAERSHEEREAGALLSFFAGPARHVVLKEKELRVMRPHGHIIRTGSSLIPDEAGLTSTAWMAGVFHSMVTQGHVSINRFLSTTHSYLGLFRSNGQRLFAELDGRWQLLDIPSAFEMTPDGCRWIYKHGSGLIEVRSTAPAERHELTLSIIVLEGAPMRFLLSSHVAMNGDDGSTPIPVRCEVDGDGVFIRSVPDCDVGWRFPDGGFRISPAPGTRIEKVGGDQLLFRDSCSRSQPFLCIITGQAASFGFTITGCLITQPAKQSAVSDTTEFWDDITGGLSIAPQAESPAAGAAERLGKIFPWFVHNALIHYLSPRGLEQYSGGGWGTRDVCQGPLEMMLAMGRTEPVRDILLRVFKQQNPDGDWPQWFMFFDRERNIRPGDSHGDIVFWPVLALAEYLISSGGAAVLDEVVPFFHPDGDDKAEKAPMRQHVERALALMQSRVIPGTHLAAYGNGDWNDSLQPVQPAMRERLCSSWTVTLHYQTLTALSAALRRMGRSESAESFAQQAQKIREDFQKILMVDETITGFAYFKENAQVDYLLHPRDKETGLSYSLLPMIHAIINNLLSPQQAEKHLNLIKEHLHGPDGARLFDRPLVYHGGLQSHFQRAESTSYFGRENGLMYTHAHLRYAEALAHYGDADGFFAALCRACPVGIRELVPSAALRQANCYYSSSDPAFSDRYQAYQEYDRVMKGDVPLEGGWRVYSSGAGIFVRLFMQCFLGLRWQAAVLEVDPVIPAALNGLRVTVKLAGHVFEVTYHSRGNSCGPSRVTLNGADLSFTHGTNPYRTGAAQIPMSTVREHLKQGANRLIVEVG